MFDAAKLFRLISPLITLLLLVVLAFQVARLVWHVAVTEETVRVPEIISAEKKSWFTSLSFVAPVVDEQAVNTNENIALVNVKSAIKDWVLKGVYAEAGDSVAIIETPKRSYVVEVGEPIEAGYTVVAISPDNVRVAKNGESTQTLSIANNHLDSLTANVKGGGGLALATRQLQRPKQLVTTPTSQFQQQADIFNHVTFVPKVIDGQPALQLSAKSTEGFTQLRRFGLRQGDILLSIDGQTPSPEMWRVVAAKWRASQTITAKVKRHRNIETVTIENK